MFIIRNTLTEKAGEPFSGTDIWWLDGSRGFHPEAGKTYGDEKIYSYIIGTYDARYYDKTGSIVSFDDETDACTVTPTTQLKSLSDLKDIRKAQLAATRYEHEIGGLTLNGVAFGTDREDQAMVTGALVAFDAGAITEIKWKSADGFVTLDATAFVAVATAVADHVQACFSNEANLVTSIDACETANEVLAVDLDSGWPV